MYKTESHIIKHVRYIYIPVLNYPSGLWLSLRSSYLCFNPMITGVLKTKLQAENCFNRLSIKKNAKSCNIPQNGMGSEISSEIKIWDVQSLIERGRKEWCLCFRPKFFLAVHSIWRANPNSCLIFFSPDIVFHRHTLLKFFLGIYKYVFMAR